MTSIPLELIYIVPEYTPANSSKSLLRMNIFVNRRLTKRNLAVSAELLTGITQRSVCEQDLCKERRDASSAQRLKHAYCGLNSTRQPKPCALSITRTISGVIR